jgi:hypothetical protein
LKWIYVKSNRDFVTIADKIWIGIFVYVISGIWPPDVPRALDNTSPFYRGLIQPMFLRVSNVATKHYICIYV